MKTRVSHPVLRFMGVMGHRYAVCQRSTSESAVDGMIPIGEINHLKSLQNLGIDADNLSGIVVWEWIYKDGMKRTKRVPHKELKPLVRE